MTKTEIARRLHEMVDERLFGNKPWPVGKESANGVHTTLLELGLMEYVPGMDQSFRNPGMDQSFRNAPLETSYTLIYWRPLWAFGTNLNCPSFWRCGV